MAVQCSVCRNREVASLVNELLFQGEGLDAIAEASACHRSSINRHKHAAADAKCEFSFRAYKIARLKLKNKSISPDSRVIVAWPGNTPGFAPDACEKFTLMADGSEIPRAELSPADVILRVEYQAVDIYRVPNPPALNNPTTRKLAEAEHQLRGFPKTSDLDSPD